MTRVNHCTICGMVTSRPAVCALCEDKAGPSRPALTSPGAGNTTAAIGVSAGAGGLDPAPERADGGRIDAARKAPLVPLGEKPSQGKSACAIGSLPTAEPCGLGSALSSLPPGGGSPVYPQSGPGENPTASAPKGVEMMGQPLAPDFVFDAHAITQSGLCEPMTGGLEELPEAEETTPALTPQTLVSETPQGLTSTAERRYQNIRKCLGIAAIGFLEAGRLLREARAGNDWTALGMPDWESYVDDLGLSKSHASRLMAVAALVESRGIPLDIAQAAGETRLYYAHRMLKSGKEVNLARLSEQGCQELRQSLGYQARELLWVCRNCGEETEARCPKCHQLLTRRVAPAKKE